ncbi:GntR family transcriptional regulator [Streptomyces odontomachi]|uniref:GntR family transcriptional regulator n=1 Tax=Streptomyces odontomachi TaxID=2944940 RepID=UPI00210CB8BC|nr:GntR family transcriptional regulator [Streptomyces sp. ODS25]
MSEDKFDPEGIRRTSSESLHEQLAERLRVLVSQLPQDSKVPTEMELVERYGVSRTTVRRALGALVESGLLVRRQGAGTFVAPQKLVHPLDQLRPFVSIFASVGKRPEGRILRFAWSEEPGDLVGLDVPEALLVRRLYTIDGAPQAMADISVPGAIGQLISRAQIEEHPIYQVLQQQLGLTLSHGEITLTSVAAPADLADPLGISAGEPLLVLSRTTYDKTGRIVEHAVYHLLPDRFELRLTVDADNIENMSYSFRRPAPTLVMRPTEPPTPLA